MAPIPCAEPRLPKSTSKPAIFVQSKFCWAKIESTVRYLGVDVEDALALAEATEV
jgi:hypothetical protein